VTEYVILMYETGDEPMYLNLNAPEDFVKEFSAVIEHDCKGEILERDLGGVKGAFLVSLESVEPQTFYDLDTGVLMPVDVFDDEDIREALINNLNARMEE